ncbi:MAG: TerC family protein [Planctomycetes bacterium]|nr:TerC family protein [Planctomycetota bacterium]
MPLASIETSVTNPLVWLGFVALVIVAIFVDLGLYRRAHGMTTRMALGWAVVWVLLALAFAGGVWRVLGPVKAGEFLAGYLLEKSLSVDNLFVFILVFAHFRTPRAEQHRVLVWGIIGAMVLRAIMILAGAKLVAEFDEVLLFFAAILFWSGLKLLFKGDEGDEDPSDTRIVRAARALVPITDGYRGHAFFVIEDGKRKATLLFLVLVVIEASDVLFAVDSIPAIFGVTKDPFIVFTSNIFAILGLRSLFFVIEAAIQRLRFLKVGLAFLLCFIAVKMCIPFVYEFAHEREVHLPTPFFLDVDATGHVKLGIAYSLGMIVATLGATTVLSLLWTPPQAPAPAAPAPGGAPSSTSGRQPVSDPASTDGAGPTPPVSSAPSPEEQAP